MTGRPARVLVVIIITAAWVVGLAGPGQAAGTAGYCPDGNGVTVVVDYNELGGGVVIRCAPGEQATGLAALQNAGFTVTGTVRWGTAFVCRINGKPGVDTEPCVDTPPTTAYWSYWHAPNGGTWTYSNLGVRARKPPLGSFEGWSFSAGRSENTAPRPGAAPVRPAPPPPPAPTTTKPQPRTVTQGPARGPAAPTTTGVPAIGSAAPASTGTESGATVTEDFPPPAAVKSRRTNEFPVGTVAGVALAAVLATAALVAARKRRGGLDTGG